MIPGRTSVLEYEDTLMQSAIGRQMEGKYEEG